MTAAPTLNELSDSPAATALDMMQSSEGAFQRLLENHLPLVRSIVERMRRKLPSKIEADELYSIGVTGLVAAARNYRPSTGEQFCQLCDHPNPWSDFRRTSPDGLDEPRNAIKSQAPRVGHFQVGTRTRRKCQPGFTLCRNADDRRRVSRPDGRSPAGEVHLSGRSR